MVSLRDEKAGPKGEIVKKMWSYMKGICRKIYKGESSWWFWEPLLPREGSSFLSLET